MLVVCEIFCVLMIFLIFWSFDFFATTSLSRFINVFWLEKCEIINFANISFFFNILFIVAIWLLISFCFCYFVSLVSRFLCDVNVTIFLFFYSIVIIVKIVDTKKMRIFAFDIVVFVTCSTRLLRNVFFVLIQSFFLVEHSICHSTWFSWHASQWWRFVCFLTSQYSMRCFFAHYSHVCLFRYSYVLWSYFWYLKYWWIRFIDS